MIKALVEALDPEDNEHWTDAGLPKVDVVSQRYGGNVTRSDINYAVPNFKRTDAEVKTKDPE